MMFSCGYFLYFEGIFSYAGFVAIEVLVISTLSSGVMLMDALTALKCGIPNE